MKRYFPSSNNCPVCAESNIEPILEVNQVPVYCNLLLPEKALALDVPRGDIRLGYCPTCTHVYNYAFDPTKMAYTQSYENSLHFSPHFQEYADALAAELIDRYDLHDKTIVEIGSGKGDFLIMLCELGPNRGLGFDPSYEPELTEQRSDRVTFIQEYYSEKYADLDADLICCRHVLEHIAKPSIFMQNIREAIGDRDQTPLFFEVPNVMYTLVDLGIWDIIYEHPSYFNSESLTWLFTQTGFEVQSTADKFSGQFLTIDALPTRIFNVELMNLKGIREYVTLFSDNYNRKIEAWQLELEKINNNNQRAVVWGAGSKGVSFLNTVSSNEVVKYVADLNPRKQGMFISGTGQEIVSPAFLKEYRPDLVILMNPNYEDEIGQMLHEMDLDPTCLVA